MYTYRTAGKVTQKLHKYEFYKVKDLYHGMFPKCSIKNEYTNKII